MNARPLLVWLAGTGTATAIAWIAVSQVTAQAVDPLPAGVAAGAPEAEARPAPRTPAPAPVTPSPPPPAPPTQPPTQPPPATTTRSYQLVGGHVTIRFGPEAVEVVSVTPAPGFAVKDINRHGPLDVEVELRSDEARSRLRAWWDGGARHRIDEDR